MSLANLNCGCGSSDLGRGPLDTEAPSQLIFSATSPPCLVDTTVGNLLADPILRDKWVDPPRETAQDKIVDVLTQCSTNAERLDLQAKLHRKKELQLHIALLRLFQRSHDEGSNKEMQPLLRGSILFCAIPTIVMASSQEYL